MKSIIDLPKKMKALVLHSVGALRYEEVDVPSIEEGMVLLKIKACGICSSDIPRIFVTGTYHFPTVPGHEFSGQIVAVGDDADEKLLGKRSCVFPILPCATCKACEKGEWAQCSSYDYFGSRCDGGFSEYLAVPKWNLVLFSDKLSYVEAALCEPAAVSLHAVSIGELKCGENVLIVGTGTIGFLIGLFAKNKIGSGRVLISGRSNNKLAYARKLGFETINTSDEDIISGIKRITGADGVSVSFEAVGSNSAVETAIRATDSFGKVVLVGNPSDDLQLEKNVYWSILRKQIKILGSWNSNYNSRINDWQKAVKFLESAEYDFKSFISHKFSLHEFEKAFSAIKDPDEFTIKVMFTFDL